MPLPTISKAGITTDAAGTRVVPSSVRADGSVRREIKVRPGYRPPEDVELYKNRTAESWKNRYAGGIPGAEAASSSSTSAASAVGSSESAGKNAKRREARRKAAAAAAAAASTGEEERVALTDVEASAKPSGAGAEVPAEVSEEDAKEKEARKLAKKLRQARELKDKEEKGDALLPEQLAKVIKINELVRQLDALGFDADAVRKGKPADASTAGK